MTLAVETSGLHYRVGNSFELHPLDLHLPVGSVYGFLGPNGSGKTTTLRLLLGLLRRRAGAIRVLGQPMPERAPQVLARVGYVPEAPHFDPILTIREILDYQAAFYPTWDEGWAVELLTQFELDAARPFGRLSKGQKAKTLMLAALAQRPDLLVLDEPTDGLDPVARRDILAALLEYVGGRKASVIILSHLVHELERICDWVGIMDVGRLVAETPMATLRHGSKRITIRCAPTPGGDCPFVVLARRAADGRETWTVRGWAPEMTAWFGARGGEIERIEDLDLEDGFVELLRAFRRERGIQAS